MDVLRAWMATQKAVPRIAMAAASSRWPQGLMHACVESLDAFMLDVAAAWRAAHPSPRVALITPLPQKQQIAWRKSKTCGEQGISLGMGAGCQPVDAWKVLVKRPQGALPFAPQQHHSRPLLPTAQQPASYQVVQHDAAGRKELEGVPDVNGGYELGASEEDYTELQIQYPDVSYSLVEPSSRAVAWGVPSSFESANQVRHLVSLQCMQQSRLRNRKLSISSQSVPTTTVQAGAHTRSIQKALEGSVLLLEPQRAKDFTLPSHSRPISIAPESRHSEKPAEPAFHVLTEPSNDTVLRPRLAPVNFETMQGHPVPQMDSSNDQDNAEESVAESGPGAYSPPTWLQVSTGILLSFFLKGGALLLTNLPIHLDN